MVELDIFVSGKLQPQQLPHGRAAVHLAPHLMPLPSVSKDSNNPIHKKSCQYLYSIVNKIGNESTQTDRYTSR